MGNNLYNTFRHLIVASVMLMIICVAVSASDLKRGYRGFFDINGKALFENKDSYYHHKDIVYSTLGFSTTHGYQFNRHFFVGGGIGLEAIIFNTQYDVIHIGAPIYVIGRTDWNLGKVPLFADLKIGTTVELGYVDMSQNFTITPSIGYRADWGRKVAMNIGIGITLQHFDNPGLGIPEKFKFLPTARIGIEF